MRVVWEVLDGGSVTELILQDYFYYDESSPSCLRWKTEKLMGNQAGTLDRSNGYYKLKFRGKTVYAHRIVYEILSGEHLGDSQVDHVNGVRTDNRYANLRSVSHAENGRNVKKPTTNKSGVTGVSRNIQYGNNKVYEYWQAYYTTLDKRSVTKAFSISKLGNEAAFNMACEWRKKMIEELNDRGANYTTAHGERE